MKEHLGIIDRSYVLMSRLGEGGMGAVYAATQLVNNQKLALKLVTPNIVEQAERTSPSQFHSRVELQLALAREFQMLASLHHPNVIRVQSYGFDVYFGSYYTMELLSGPQTILAAGQAAPVQAKVLLVAQLLRALAYIHRRGVIHRDIKPSNVVVVGEEVKLLDFGISVGTSGSEDIAGTVDYMAPELLLGAPPSVSSDLYAVGLILHELLTSHLPGAKSENTLQDARPYERDADLATRTFSGVPGAAQAPTGHVAATAAFALDGRDDFQLEYNRPIEVAVGGPLGEVLRRTLNPDPSARFQSAEELLHALGEALGQQIPSETSETRESFLRATVLVGREAELAMLRHGLDQLKKNIGSGFLIGGESGVGKTRLISELRTLALVYGFWVAEGQSTTESGSAFQEWQPLLRALCFRTELSDSEAAIFKPLVPDIATLLDRPIPDPPVVKPEDLLLRLANALRGIFKRQSRPLLIILEDLQWAKEDSLGLLALLSKDIASLPVLLLGNYRSDERPELPQRLPELCSIVLGRLGQDAIAQLARSMLGSIGNRPEIVDYLLRQTEGNVFFLVEVVRALAEDAGELERIGQGELPERVYTTGIERIIERRIEHVDPVFRPALEFAATLGRRLDLAVLAYAFPQVPIRSLLLQCANAAVLESQGSDWRFAHDKLRETILQRPSEEDRKQLHRQVAEAMEATYAGEDRERLSAQLALHFRRAGNIEQAIHYDVQAGDRAARLGFLSDARSHYREALVAFSQMPDTADNRRQRVDVMLRLIQNSLIADVLDVQLQRVAKAQALIDSLVEGGGLDREVRLRQVRLDYLTGRVYYYAGKLMDAIRMYERVLPEAQELGVPELIAMPSAVMGQALTLQGNLGKALSLLTSASGLLVQLGNQVESIRCQSFIGWCMVGMGNYRQGLAVFAEAARVAKERNQPVLLVLYRLLMAPAHGFAMNWPAALETIAGVGNAVLRGGEKVYAMIAWTVESMAHAHLGNWDLAHQLLEQILTLKKELGGRFLIVDLQESWYSEIMLLESRYKEALRAARAVIETFGDTEHWLAVGIAQRIIASSLSQLRGSPAEVDQHFREAISSFTKGQNVLYIGQAELAWGQSCVRRQERQAALEHFQAAHTIFRDAGCDHALPAISRQIAEQA